MLTFKGYVQDISESEILNIIEETYGSVDVFLSEAAHNIADQEKYQKANKIAQQKSDLVKNLATKDVEHHLGNYGRSLHSSVDPDPVHHLNDDDLFVS